MTLHRLKTTAGDLLPDALLIGGAASVAFGAGLVYPPAGWIVGGLFAMAAGWLLVGGSR